MRVVTITLEQQGSLFKVKRLKPINEPNQPYAIRGKITSFSHSSRMRMIEMFARMDRKKLSGRKCLFITLTYEWLMRDSERAKRDLKTFCERIQRKFKRAFVVWRMEEQRSGSIHFHLLLGNVGFWKVEKAQDAWNEVTGGSARNSLDLKLMRSYKGVRSYVSKYVAKDVKTRVVWLNPRFDSMVAVMMLHNMRPMATFLMGLAMSHIFAGFVEIVGRRWGVYGRQNVPYAEKVTCQMSANLYRYLLAVLQDGSEYARWWQNFTILDDYAKQKYFRFIQRLGTRYQLGGAALKRRMSISRYYYYVEWLTNRANRIRKRIEQEQRNEALFLAWVVKNGLEGEYGVSVNVLLSSHEVENANGGCQERASAYEDKVTPQQLLLSDHWVTIPPL